MDRVMASAAGGAMASIVRKVGSMTVEQGARLMGVPANIDYLKRELKSMHAFLMGLSDIEDPDEVVKCCRDELRELSYDMEDAIDRFELGGGDGRGSHLQEGSSSSSAGSRFMGRFRHSMDLVNCVKSRYAMAGEIERLKDRVSEAEHRWDRYSLGEPAVRTAIDTRVVALYREAVSLVGTDGPMETIIGWLMGGDSSSLPLQDRMVVSIVGFGGIGKTTLAKQIFDKIKGQFDCAAFVSVSRKPRINYIIKEILSQFQRRCPTVELENLDPQGSEEPFIEMLKAYLRDKRYFVVVDDIWSSQAWKIMECGLFNNGRGSRIITTTRIFQVAKCCSFFGGHIHRMKPLCYDDSRRLFLKRVFDSEVCPLHMETALDKILKKCDGSPLAILTVSSLLVGKVTPCQWEQVCISIGLGICQDDDVSAMRRILSHSYFDLPQHLRTCLLYLSIFPEDWVIKRKSLVYRWIAEGFVNAQYGENTTDVGESYFHELINRNLIQPVEIKYNGQVKACRVHDTILDFIISKCLEENFVKLHNAQDQIFDKKIRHLSIHSTFKSTPNLKGMEQQDLSHIRSLTIFHGDIAHIPSGLVNLRVLDLDQCRHGYDMKYGASQKRRRYVNVWDPIIHNVAECYHLKYLRLPYSFCNIERVPDELGRLKHLQTLDLTSVITLKDLPPSLSKLRLLVRLFVSSTTKLPDAGIGDMKLLEELHHINITNHSMKFLHELGRLIQLRVLRVGFRLSDIKDEQKLVVFLSSLLKLGSSLHSLSIRAYDDKDELTEIPWMPPSIDNLWREALVGLRKISMYTICGVPNWIVSLNNLATIKLMVRGMWRQGLDILGGLQNLLVLSLTFTYAYEDILVFSSSNGFQHLTYLAIDWPLSREKRRIRSLVFEAGSLRRIEHLKLQLDCTSSCTVKRRTDGWEALASTISTLSGSEIATLYEFGIENLSSLTTLEVDNDCCCPSAAEICEAAMKKAISKLPSCPTFKLENGKPLII